MSRVARVGRAVMAAGVLAWGIGCTDAVTRSDLGQSDAAEIDVAADEPGDVLADPAADPAPDPATEATDVKTDVGPKPYLSARKVAKKSDLVGGPQAYGVVGQAYLVENSKVRFLIQDADTAVHHFVHGGSLIDADLKRPAGQAGGDRWHEMFPVVGGRVSSVDQVEVLKDGADGDEAIVRTTGTDVTTGIVPLLDNLAAEPLGVTIVTDYIVEPDEPWVRIRTEVRNPGATKLHIPIIGDFLAFGGTEHVFTPETGYDGSPKGPLSAIASSGDGVSYAYTVMAGGITVPEIDVSGTIGFLGNDFTVPANGSAVFDRFLVVGEGDVASVLDHVRSLRNEEAYEVVGTVKDGSGAAIPGATVTFFRSGEARPDSGKHAIDQAVARANGGFRARVPPGTYDLVASAPGRLRVIQEGVVASPESTSVDIRMGGQGRVRFEVVEVGGEPPVEVGRIAAKATFECGADALPEWRALGERRWGGACAALFTATGEPADYAVPPGRYRVVVSHGPEYEIAVFDDVVVEAGKTTWVGPQPDKPVALRRVVDTAGWVAADFHQHGNGSLDTPVTPGEHLVENLAEGVEVAALTDHDMLSSWDAAIQALGASSRFKGLTGDEVSYNTVGHFNIFPAEGAVIAADGTAGPLLPFAGAKLFASRTIPELVQQMRTIPGVSFVQINHPRSGLYAYLGWIRFDPVTGKWGRDVSGDAPEEPIEWGFDAIEVKGSIGQVTDFVPSSDALISQLAANGAGEDAIPVMRDWFAWLNLGRAVAGTGNSDTSFPNEGSGWPRNLVRVGKVAIADLSTADFVAAVKAQKVVVSNGPFIRTTVAGKERMGHTEPVEPVSGKVVLHVEVQAPPWMDVNALEVYANGRPVPLVEVGGVLIHMEEEDDPKFLSTPVPISNTTPEAIRRVDIDIELFPREDTWYVVLVRGAGHLEPAGRGTPYAYTNPVYVDHDGGGFRGVLE